MEVSIKTIRDNPLLGRRNVELEVDHEGEPTPSKEDVTKRFSAENDLDTEKVEIDTLKTGYGSKTAVAKLKVYQDFDYDEELEKDAAEAMEEEIEAREQETETSSDTADYDEVVGGTITDAKSALDEMEDPDWEAALKAEKDSKNRTTLIDWLESRVDE